MVLETWKLRAMVIMPDHIHLLVGLEAKSVSDSVRIFKGRLSPKLRKHNLKWQSGFYDHRLRPKDKLSGVVRYMWLNPYRAGICNEGEAWPGWWCDEAVTEWIGADTKDYPPPEWWRGENRGTSHSPND